jgi:hypothetical protein
MARQESDREDLLREATALVERAEIEVAGEPEPVFAGFRRNGAFSLFFGPQFVIQLNVAGEVRRGFHEGCLLKAESGVLVELRRERHDREVQLIRRTWDDAATKAWLLSAEHRIESLRRVLDSGEYRVVGQEPAEAHVLDRVCDWLDNRGALRIADRPNA